MRVLIDECVDPRVKAIFTGHECTTVHDEGWDTLEDGPLLALAQQQFDVLITIDGNIEFQQNIPKLQMGIIVAHVAKNRLVHYQALQRDLLEAVETIQAGQLVHVPATPT